MRESWKTRRWRWYFNLFPAYWGTGGRIRYISSDWKEVQIQIALNWQTRNLVKTIFGGSLYGAVDPIYMIMLMKLLGPTYQVWDKSASIRFKKPGRTRLQATFKIDEDEIREIKTLLEQEAKIDRIYTVELVDHEGTVHASVEKVINIRKK